jgi:hypothetical protein
MDLPLVIRGTFVNKTFLPTDPLPEAEGPAELIVHVQPSRNSQSSIFDVLGKAETLRTADDLDAQLQDERTSWGDA